VHIVGSTVAGSPSAARKAAIAAGTTPSTGELDA